ncbi:ZIP family metal transporter [Acidipila sp. EB88]|uniref:ZIP family metal transporter n=1 Tax=Acidipila sp. EB88 TaxID=2305226 RepID=UPI000F6031EB|nr:ZIP family metal transporter [Acidipila sp. EB88]RRA50106.1 zinc permease [Acidipila sp. EB88]
MLGTVLAVQVVAVAAAWLLRSREQQLQRQLPYLLSLAVGVLLATAILHLLPEAVDALGNGRGTWLAVGLTLLVLFAVERVFHSYAEAPATIPAQQDPAHAPGADCAHQPCAHLAGAKQGMRPLNLMLGSCLHSFVDGTAIATAFAIRPNLGLLTAFAVALHEVPHRLGDVAVLLHLGVPAPRAMRFAVVAALPAVAGALAVLALGAGGASVFRWLLPVSAGSFLYIAGVNLLPELAEAATPRAVYLQLVCLCAGSLIVMLITGLHAG